MRTLLFALTLPLFLQAQDSKPAAAPKKEAQPLSFLSKRFPYAWDQLIPLKEDVDGIKLNAIFFNRREVVRGPFKGADFGTRAQIEVTNNSGRARTLGFAVAVLDGDGRLLGVASGGTRLLSLKPGATSAFDLPFEFVLERLPLGTSFMLSVEMGE